MDACGSSLYASVRMQKLDVLAMQRAMKVALFLQALYDINCHKIKDVSQSCLMLFATSQGVYYCVLRSATGRDHRKQKITDNLLVVVSTMVYGYA
eukprot:6213723-Pleurochrysis_carterae.AAC.1